MEIISIIGSVLAAVGGVSGIIALYTAKETKKGMQLDNAQKEDNRWEKLADQLSDQVDKLNKQIEDINIRMDKKDALLTEKDDLISDLRNKLDLSRSKCVASDLLKCLKISCLDREPKIGTRYVDVQQIIEDSEK